MTIFKDFLPLWLNDFYHIFLISPCYLPSPIKSLDIPQALLKLNCLKRMSGMPDLFVGTGGQNLTILHTFKAEKHRCQFKGNSSILAEMYFYSVTERSLCLIVTVSLLVDLFAKLANTFHYLKDASDA